MDTYENGMIKIKARSLVLIIQAIDSEIQELKRGPVDGHAPEHYLLLEEYMDVARELKIAYAEAGSKIINFPHYKKLVTEDIEQG